jgi:3-oxoacyl-[acyl-carrier protein] reductase
VADRYTALINTGLGERLADLVGLPRPAVLRRHEPGQPPLDGPALVGGEGRLASAATEVLRAAGVEVHPSASDDGATYGALVFDATGVVDSEGLAALHAFFHPAVRRLGASGRVVVLGTVPAAAETAEERAAQRALEGLTRSLAKELRAGATANLVEVWPGAEAGLGAPLRFLCSARSAFVSGQRITVGPATDTPPVRPDDPERPLAGQVVLVTGAARGIGAAIARTAARDGATVVCVDVPAAGDALARVAGDVGGSALQLDITGPRAPEALLTHAVQRHGGLDVVVHNAGITRDKTMAGMDAERWSQVLGVNLAAVERIDAHLLESDGLREDGRIVCVASMSGIAGNRGQTAYAASKAGVIGHVEALAPALAARGGTINAVAPGFIETDMTARMPAVTREVGRRLNSLSQGGQPVDVAEAILYLAGRDAAWVNGTTLRVCGQNLLGA